jgi:hypothetical protein
VLGREGTGGPRHAFLTGRKEKTAAVMAAL